MVKIPLERSRPGGISVLPVSHFRTTRKVSEAAIAARDVSFVNAYNAVYLRAKEIPEVYTWDTDFGKVEGITRVEPQE